MRRQNQAAAQQAQGYNFQERFLPAPLKGWNTTQNPHGGDPKYASTFLNWWASEGSVSIRPGSAIYADRAAAGRVKSLYVHRTPAAVEKFFAFTDNGIYDITSAGTYVGAVQALTEGLWQGVIFTNPAGTEYLWGVNGVDSALHFDGATWANPTITGVTSADLKYVWVFKRRLFCIEKNSMNCWYLPVDSIAGAATKLPVGGNFARGGYLLSGFTWTLDGGNGPDDYCGFVTSQGEVAIYQGTDPDAASSWGLIGVFFIGRPAAARCWARVGADILIATQFGLVSLSQIVKGAQVNPQSLISKNIWNEWLRAYGSAMTSGTIQEAFCVVTHPAQNALIINIPLNIINAPPYQFMLNLETGAWAKFDGWGAVHFAVRLDVLYYALQTSVGAVNQCWVGNTADVGVAIDASITQVASKFLGGRDFLSVQVKPDFRNNGGTVNTLCGAEAPPTMINRWINPYLSAPANPADYLAITFTTTTTLGQTWYGTNIRYLPVPISV